MAVKVLIRRRVDHRHTDKVKKLLSALEDWASKQAGYFYGEHLEDPECPGELLCIGTWRSEEAFKQWSQSTPAQQMELKMALSYGMQSDRVVYIRNSHT